jgi:hypothetical protein
MSRGRREQGGFRTNRRLTRRELMTAAVGGLSAALPARAEEQPGKLSQIAAAYQSTPKACLVAQSARCSSARAVARW